ncbi:MAG: septal ring lytic transglycosylase RlpA family protein [Burkholderiales bacterium]
MLRVLAALAISTLAACGSAEKRDPVESTDRTAAATPPPTSETKPTVKPPATGPRGGAYYLDDGPGDNPPPDLDKIPDAVPKLEPLNRGTARPYSVMGRSYTPMTTLGPYRARGIATWYGRRYHGLKTSSGEPYDMYAMTAAHTLLPIPSYVRVTNPANGKAVVVRVNDRGPFIGDRLIDLSYTAAWKLGLLAGGSGVVEVELIVPGADNTAPRPATAETPAIVSVTRTETPGGQPVLPMTSGRGGLYIQLGAFGAQDNADNYLARIKAQLDWLAPQLHVFPRDGLFRIHAGPFASQVEAREAADRISQALGIKTIVLTR